MFKMLFQYQEWKVGRNTIVNQEKYKRGNSWECFKKTREFFMSPYGKDIFFARGTTGTKATSSGELSIFMHKIILHGYK